jgi:hypothetical protein
MFFEKYFKIMIKNLNSILISLTFKICQNLSFRKKLKLLNMSFYCLKTLITLFY